MVYEDPRPRTRSTARREEIKAFLDAKPGTWARIGKGQVSHWKKTFGAEYEFCTRTLEGEQVVYGRKLGTIAAAVPAPKKSKSKS